MILARAGAVVNDLNGARMKLVGHHPDGFDACNFKAEQLKETFGIEVDQTPILDFISEVKKLPDSVSDAPYERRAKISPIYPSSIRINPQDPEGLFQAASGCR